jgi:hypothetical protein
LLRSPVQVTRSVSNQRHVRGIFPVFATGEAVEHGLVACWIDLEHRAPGVLPAYIRGAVEIASAIQKQVSLRISPVGRAAEAMQHRQVSGGVYLEHVAVAPTKRGAIQIASRVPYQPTIGILPIRPTGEGVQDSLVPSRIYLEHRSVIARARAPDGCAIEIPGRIRITPALGLAPSVPVPVKEYRTVSLPVLSTLNTAPMPKAPPFDAVP